jgi:trans-aconitate 2-methyltransferase
MAATTHSTNLYGNNLNNKKEYWNESYHKNSNFQYEAGQKAINSLGLTGDEQVLDIGCGTGRTSAYLANSLTSGSLLGIDSSSSMINFAQKEYANISNLKFQQLDVLDLNFNEEFDLVFSTFCLHWVKEQQLAIKNIYQSVKPGGKALLYIPCNSKLFENWKLILQKLVTKYPNWNSSELNPTYLLSEDQWICLAKEEGFKIENSFILERSINFTKKELLGHVKALNTAPDLDDKERAVFIEEATQGLYDIYNKNISDKFEYKTNTVVLKLSKQT